MNNTEIYEDFIKIMEVAYGNMGSLSRREKAIAQFAINHCCLCKLLEQQEDGEGETEMKEDGKPERKEPRFIDIKKLGKPVSIQYGDGSDEIVIVFKKGSIKLHTSLFTIESEYLFF